ncbi:MAG: glycosyltransferase [Methylotetracoccus sp.]
MFQVLSIRSFPDRIRFMPVRTYRIALIIDSLARAGAQRQVVLLLEGLRAHGHQVLVLALNDDTDPDNRIRIGALADLHIIGKLRLALELGPIGLWHRLREWRADLILTMLDVSDVLGRIAGRLYHRGPIVSSIRGPNLHKRPWWLLLDRLTIPWADRVVFNSHSVAAGSRERLGLREEQIRVIANGIEPALHIAEPADRMELGIPPHARVVLTVGRLYPEKRFDSLLDAFARLPADTHLLIVGIGILHESLAEQTARLGLTGRVHFLGRRHDVPALLALSEVFVLPSAWEGMPNVIMEAMAAGCPIVATRIDGTLELLPDPSFGWLVDPGQPEQLAGAIGTALEDRAESKARARRALARITDEFGAGRMVQRYEALFDELLGGMPDSRTASD